MKNTTTIYELFVAAICFILSSLPAIYFAGAVNPAVMYAQQVTADRPTSEPRSLRMSKLRHLPPHLQQPIVDETFLGRGGTEQEQLDEQQFDPLLDRFDPLRRSKYGLPHERKNITADGTGHSEFSTLTDSVQEAWIRHYASGLAPAIDRATAVAIDALGNIYVTGSSTASGTSYDYATIKYNLNGDTVWVRSYDGPGNSDDGATSLAIDGSGNVYVTGESYSGTSYDYATIKYNSNGDTVWVRRYDGPGNSYDAATSLAIDGSGNAYVTGYSYGLGTYSDYATIKYNSNGDTVWVRRYDGPGNFYDAATSLAIDGSGNVYVTGWSVGSGTSYDYATIKYNSNGDTVWVRRYNGPGNDNDRATSLAIDGSGNVYVTGRSGVGSGTSDDYATIKYSAAGDEEWVARYNRPGDADDEPSAIRVDGAGGVYVTGSSSGSGWWSIYTTIKYNQIPVSVEERSPALPGLFALDQNYPNPFNPVTVIQYAVPSSQYVSLKVYNVLGEVVATLVDGVQEAGYKSVEWDAGKFPSGVYFYRLNVGEYFETKKMLLIK